MALKKYLKDYTAFLLTGFNDHTVICHKIFGRQWIQKIMELFINLYPWLTKCAIFYNYRIRRNSSFYIVAKSMISYIITSWWLSICYKCILIRVCFRQQSNQSSLTECLTYLCPVYTNQVLQLRHRFIIMNKQLIFQISYAETSYCCNTVL